MAVTAFNHFPAVAAAMRAGLSDIVAETTVDLGDAMVAQIYANGQVATGFMVSSVYTVTKNGSTYGQAGTPPGDSYLLPEAPLPTGDGMSGVAACAANYGEWQNNGTRFLPPRPFKEPAVELINGEFQAKLAGLEGRMHV